MEILFCPKNDFSDMEWPFCRKEYVVGDGYLGLTFFWGLSRFLALS